MLRVRGGDCVGWSRHDVNDTDEDTYRDWNKNELVEARRHRPRDVTQRLIDRRRHWRESRCGEQADDTDDGDVSHQPRSAHAVLSQQRDFLFEGDQHDSLPGDHDNSAGDDDTAGVEQTVDVETHTLHRRRLQATSGSRHNDRPEHDRGEGEALGQVDDARVAKDCPESVPLDREPVAGRHPDEIDVGTQTHD